jgi:hypothetical protein
MIDLQKIQDNVRLLLTKYPFLRNLKTRKIAIWKYWEEFEGIDRTCVMSKQAWLKVTNPETISRAIRKCQEQNPGLRPLPDEQLKRYEQANVFAGFYRKKETEEEKLKKLSQQCL